jgi:hypothetical protein
MVAGALPGERACARVALTTSRTCGGSAAKTRATIFSDAGKAYLGCGDRKPSMTSCSTLLFSHAPGSASLNHLRTDLRMESDIFVAGREDDDEDAAGVDTNEEGNEDMAP